MPKEVLYINNFAKAGLNTDILPWDLPPEFLTDIRNIRITRNRLYPFGGSANWATLPADFVPGFIMHVGSTSGDYWLIAGSDTVYVYDGTAFTDVYTAGFGVNEDNWHGCMLSQIPIISNPDYYPLYWPQQAAGVQMEILPWDDTRNWQEANESAQIIRSHKQFLFALDLLTGGGTEIPDGVRWSAPADVNGVPPTWDPLDTTQTAGFVTLGGDGGKIIDGLSLRDAFVVYRESSISIFDYVGGQFIWRIRHLSTTAGLIAPDSIIEVKGRHFFIGDGDIFVNDGNSIESLMHNKIRLRFSGDIDPDYYQNSYAVRNNLAGEIWFCIPSQGNQYPDTAYIYNWRDDSWSIRDIPAAPFANYGKQSSPVISWDESTSNWDEAIGTWNRRQLTPLDDTIISCTKPDGGSAGELLLLDLSTYTTTEDFVSSLERVGMPLMGLDNVTTITRVYPHCSGPGSFYIQVGSQDFPGAPTRWKPAVEFNPSTDRKFDIRTTGELHCFKVYSNSVANWSLSGLDIEYTYAGKR